MATISRIQPAEAELRLFDRHDKGYGTYYSGVVEAKDREVKISWRQAETESGHAYVLATGWLGAKDSMRVPAHEAVRWGHAAITFDYSNQKPDDPIGENVKDLAAVLDALPEYYRKHALGLSMGGYVTAKAVEDNPNRVEEATLVASAGFITGQHSLLEVGKHLSSTLPEFAGLSLHHPGQAAHLWLNSVRNGIHRAKAVGPELAHMMKYPIHESVSNIKAHPTPPRMNFLYGAADGLIPAYAQVEGVDGLPFDHVESYAGRHINLIHDPQVSRSIFRLHELQQSPDYAGYGSVAA